MAISHPIDLLDYVLGTRPLPSPYRMKTEPFTAEFPALPDGTLEVAGRTDVGLIREHNEDSFLFGDLVSGTRISENDSPPLSVDAVPAMLMVADGVGGAASGEIASSMATEIAYTYLRERWKTGGLKGTVIVADALQQALFSANKAIHARALDQRSHHGMGTTATLALTVNGMIYFAQVGDSRAYIVRDGVAKQMTKDQSLVQRMVDAGKMTQEQAEKSEHRNIILQALGPEEAVVPELTRDRLVDGDIVVLCSDGLSNQVTSNEIAQTATQTPNLDALCAALVQRALDTGAPDNVTVVAARFTTDKTKSDKPSA
ncbi:MAG TPA: protein phosphatase 2C domain-containing protein [Gemmatimonadaceae bacterium]|nr:protein phosphatase 2C domain-containing protein [Gemmatimonadaceae bacterium]